MSKNLHRGSSFDSFLEEEGILEEVKALTAKRTFVHQLEVQMEKKHKKKNLFRQAFSSPATAERLFNDHIGISLETMARAYGITKIATDSKRTRDAIYKALSARGNPTFSTLHGILNTMGLELHVHQKRRA